MKKIIICSICNIFVSQVYCSDINVCFANGQHNESNRITLLFRHGDTGVSGHENYSMARVTPESLEESKKIGNILRKGETNNTLKFTTDCSYRGNDTAISLSGNFFYRTLNDFLEVDLHLSKADFKYLNAQPHTLFRAMEMFISNVVTGSEKENRASLEKIDEKYGDNAKAIISSFVRIVTNNKFKEMSTKMSAIARESVVEKNVIVHHSIFISLMMYYAKLNEIYKCDNFLDLKNKINDGLKNSPRNTYRKCFYILCNALARYRLKNLELVYLAIGRKGDVSNLQICDYDYIKNNRLYLSDSISIRKKTSKIDKLKKFFELLYNVPECDSIITNMHNAINFVVAEDSIQRKGIRLSIVKHKETTANDGFIWRSIKYMFSFISNRLSWIRKLHSYDDCL